MNIAGSGSSLRMARCEKPLLVGSLLLLACSPNRDSVGTADEQGGVIARESYAITTDSVRLYLRMVGDGPEVVLIPNALFHGTRLDALAAPTRTLVLYDSRGRGRSDSVPPAKVSLDHNLMDLETVRLSVGADSVALIGWSGAGMELFVYALRHPGRVTRLIQLAPVAPRWTPYSDSLMSSRTARMDTAAVSRLEERRSASQFVANEAALCRAASRITTPASFGDTAFAHLAPDVCEWSNEWPSRSGPYFDALLGSLGDFDWRPELPKMSVPRLVIHGERDNTPLAGNCEWVIGQPSARLLVIPEAGHWPHYERPKPTLAAIRAFLDGGWPAESRSLSVAEEWERCRPARS